VTALLLDPLADARWARLAESAPAATVFHQPGWIELLRRSYRYPVAAAGLAGPDGELVAGLPVAAVASRLTGRRLVALPFSDACPPLLAPGAPPEALASLAAALDRLRRDRGLPLHVCAPFPELAPPTVRFLSHAIDLAGGADAAATRLASRARRHARKAEKLGVEVARRADRGALETFFGLHLLTRRRLGVPTQPKRFILGLEPLLGDGRGFVAVAELDGRPAAAAVFLRGGATLTYKYGASDQDLLHARPNNLIFARAIRWAAEDGLSTLDLGRTDLGQDGLADFKRSLGAVEQPLAYTYAGAEAPSAGSSRLETALEDVIRRSPPLVGRAIGEALYRHVG
jgi:CelD/BcsL family acetyltransferase involved in cellulose biosynthesis